MESILAQNIRSFRKRMGLTQEQLAERLNITLGTVSKWERGTSEPALPYLMGLAEIFRVSVDAMIGFSMGGGDADTEADRIRAMDREMAIEQVAAEYDRALMKFPNHFRIVLGAAQCYMQIGVVYRKDAELRKAVELFRHAIGLISQNTDPAINELLLRNEIAQCYSTLKDYKKAIEEYKKNNLCGNNDAEIGLILTENEKKPEEGIGYTERAFINLIGEKITVMGGYINYYKRTGNAHMVARSAEWTLNYLKSLKEDPDRKSYLDKMISLHYLVMAMGQDMAGEAEKAEENLRMAVRLARAFDEDPVYSLENVIFYEHAKKSSVYDNTGATAMEGLAVTMEEEQEFLSEEFRKKFDKEMDA